VLQTDVKLSTQSKEILCQIAFNNTWKLAEITDFMRYVVRIDKDQVQAILHIAQTYKLEYRNVLNALDKSDPLRWLKGFVDTERHKNADTIISEMRNSNYPENVLTILEDVLVYLETELPKYRTDLHKNDIQSVRKMVKELDFTNPDRQVLKSVLVQMSLAVKMCSAVTIQKGKEEKVLEGYLPRLTQIAALVVFLLPKSITNRGCLLEIGTGEGKSCILAMLAVIHAMRGVKVDIVTSSPVLARRDLEEWSKLYKMFDIKSSAVPPVLNDVSSEELEELTQKAYKQDVVYSTVGTFAADTLKQEFEKKTTRGDRRFEMVIVDEVDYMTLDNGVQITFLSHESSGLQHLEQVLASIWAIISACRPIEVEETGETMWTTRVQSFHTAALIAMIGSDKNDTFSPLEILLPGIELGFYSEEDFENLKVSIDEEGEKQHGAIENEAWKTIMAKTGIEQQYDLLSVLEMGMEDKVAFNCYIYQLETRKVTQFGEQKMKTDQNINMLLFENGKACEMLSENLLIEATVSQLKSKIKYSRQCSSEEDKESLVIPSFLEKYLENQLPLFVENALKAIQMTKGREYMIERSLKAQGIDVDEDGQHMYHAIIPVDFQASGMLEKRKRWGDGLQQFLEMKHQLTLSPLSNVTNYMSNSNLFKRYLMGKGIFGVSGTLGGDADKGFLARHYKTDSYVIPPHQRQKVTELPAVQVRGGTDQWIQTICATVSKVSKRGQVVLVVCEDVNTANALNDKIAAETKYSVTKYTMSECHNIENQEFDMGQIIITTNLGGRGTDIKVTEEVNRCGGLFVLLTYFPNNRRVEKQVFGRTGRKGTPGMVQVILNHDRLAMAYRGHSAEVMRELKEEYKVNRIKDMEKEKLAEIEMKEEMFSTFCQFLSDFDKHYSTMEKIDLFEVKIKDVRGYFASFHGKMDYHPALNALKESWGIWLILHTDQINIHSDLTHLKEDLIQNLQDTSNKLLQGHSENFYEHIQQALGRTALHHQNKNKCDYGAKTYWKKASDSDNYYRAVALYNQAYITINLAKKGYKSEALSLLKEAEKTLDVYISETTRTLSFCSLSVTRDFEPHHSGSCNFQIQMQARMNIFNSWKQNIKKILDMLGSGSGDFKTVDLTLYSLSNEEDFVSSSELGLFCNYGLALVFEVKQKPKFSFDALICCFLGVLQVVAGVLVCTLSAGSMSSFGLGLISEGVSDMINGVMGMINGTFDWASWAISKAISIGISLVCGGFSVLKRSLSSVKNAASNILNGIKSLKSFACNALKSGKNMFASACKSTKSIVSSMKNISWTAVKPTLKHSSKYAVQELAIQGVNTALNTCIDATVQKTFQQGFKSSFKESVCSTLHQNKEFVRALTDFISSGIPKAALQKESGSYSIRKSLEKEMMDHTVYNTNLAMNDLMVNCKQIHHVINILSQVWDKSAEHVANQPRTCIKRLLSATSTSTTIYQMYSSIPTKQTIDCNFVPAFLKSMQEEALFETYDNDGRDKLADVERLKDDLIDLISEVLSQTMVESFSGSATSLFTKTFTRQLNSVTGKVVGNLLGRHETQSFFVNQQHEHDLKSVTECKERSVNEKELNQLTCFATKITDEQKPATALEVHVLTRSNLLDGKGICLSVVDDKGNLLTYSNYPGTDPEAGTINLLLTKTPQTSPGKTGMWSKLTDRVMGKDTPQSDHISIIHPDGSRETVNSSNQNCLYHAVIQATTNDPKVDFNQKAVELRHKVQHEPDHCYYKDARDSGVHVYNHQDRINYRNRAKKPTCTMMYWIGYVTSACCGDQASSPRCRLHEEAEAREAATNGDSVNLEEYTSAVTSYIGKCIDDVTVSKTITTRSNQKPWMTANVRTLLRTRDLAFRTGDRAALRTAMAKLSRAIREAKRAHAQTIHSHFQDSGDTRRMWLGIQAITNYKTASPACDSDASLPDALNDFYARFEVQNKVTARKTIPPTDDQVLCLSTADVRRSLCRVNPRKAAGPDNIPGRVLRECAEPLADVFTDIFNISLSSAVVPTCLKTTTIVPIRKKKSTVSCLNDYRPVALTPIVMKCFQKLVMRHIKTQLPPSLDPQQFAYHPNHSTDDAIATALHLALTHLDNKDTYVRMLFIDFSSAFNTIIPQHLIGKLSLLGLNTSLCNWILDFLTGRPQSVRIGNSISNTTTLNTGAPQGCVLSPLLFTLLTHDCAAMHRSIHIIKFADDMTVVGLISKNDESAYREEVQQLV
ncbi:uncharacterized protein LOC113663549 isoform X1, partial [Tachysurus ichikawai]